MQLSCLARVVVSAVVGILGTGAAHAIPTIVVAPGTSPAGYLPLSSFGISELPGYDEVIWNIGTDPFGYAGQNWNRLGFGSNGYVVVGGGTAADLQYINKALPDATAPANILAPFWTDLNPAAGGGMRIAYLTDGADTWFVADWEKVPNYSDSSVTNSFQVWIGLSDDANPGEDISFTYGAVGSGNSGLLTVGAQDVSRTVGDTYYFNGTGTLPTEGTELRVTTRDLPVSVPEPGSLVLLGVGLAGLAASRRPRT